MPETQHRRAVEIIVEAQKELRATKGDQWNFYDAAYLIVGLLDEAGLLANTTQPKGANDGD